MTELLLLRMETADLVTCVRSVCAAMSGDRLGLTKHGVGDVAAMPL